MGCWLLIPTLRRAAPQWWIMGAEVAKSQATE
jgi:hypothetical protein